MLSLSAAVALLAFSAAGNGQTVLLDFYADWCGPCHSMDSTVQALAAKGYPVRRVNVDQERDLANRFGVQGIPCFVMIVNGREAGREVGRTSMGRLEQLCALGRAAPAATAPTMLAAQPRTPPIAPAVAANAPPRRTPVIPVSWSGETPRQPASDAALLASSVRLRIEDPQGRSCGSGTIIDARPGGEALVLTCGHIFRDSNGKGRIEIDVFGSAPASHVPGHLLSYDLKRDVALVAFEPQGEITVARVAPPGFSVRQGEAVASVGCNDGADPTVQRASVVSLDRYLGPPIVQVSGQPVPGRSGGGLFTADGMVVGVCNAADPGDHEGLFAALASIHAQLDDLGLSAVYHQPPSGPAPVQFASHTASATRDPIAAGQELSAPPPMQTPSSAPAATVAPAVPASAASLVAGEQEVLDEMHRRMKDGCDVVCIVRNPKDPQGQSQVIALDHASPEFLNHLQADVGRQTAPHETSLEIPNRRPPLLEWDAEKGWLKR